MELRLVKSVSKKGNEYYAIEMIVSDDYKQLFFLSKEQVALIKVTHGDIFVER